MTGALSVTDRFSLCFGLVLLLIGPVLAGTNALRAQTVLLLQTSRLAGLRYYDGSLVWPDMKEGDVLDLRREAGNPFDGRAVAVYWHGYKLGYVPRASNADVARLLDHGVQLGGRIVSLSHTRRRQVLFEIDEMLSPVLPEQATADDWQGEPHAVTRGKEAK